MNKQLIFVLGALALLFTFFYSVSDILLPFVAGIAIAYILDPLADRIQRQGISRALSSGIVTILFFSTIIGVCVLVVPLIYHQVEGLIAKIPDYYQRFNNELLPQIKNRLARIDPDIVSGLNEQTEQLPQKLGLAVGSIFSTGIKFLNLVSLILITPIVAFYILRDWDRFLEKVDGILPRNYAPVVREQARKIDRTLAGFVRGQLNVCLLLGMVYGIALTLAGLNFGFIIGLGAGFLTFIPYVGPFIGGLTGVGVAYFQSEGDINYMLVIGAIFVIGQVAEGNFITPKLVGDRIGVHPAWLIFGMLAGGSLLGFVGVLIAVPLTAIIAVLIRFAIEEYEKSDFYIHAEDGAAAPVKTAPAPKKPKRRLLKKKK